MTLCPFCRIAADTAGATTLLESDLAVAFLDIRPLRPGHALVVPRRHEADYWSLTEAEHRDMTRLAQRLAVAQRALFQPLKVALFVAGFDVPHAHMHVVPLLEPTDLTLNPALLATLGMVPADELARQKERFVQHLRAPAG